MERHSQLTLPEILAKLAHILAHKQTGTFFIATDANTSCRFAVDSGKITHCAHKRDHGIAALLSLQETGGGSCSFSENQAIPFRADAAVDHQAALDLLGIHPEIPPKQERTAASPPAPAPAKPAPARYYRGQTAAPDGTLPTSEPLREQPATQVAASIPRRIYRGS